jgi:hypothetical protein
MVEHVPLDHSTDFVLPYRPVSFAIFKEDGIRDTEIKEIYHIHQAGIQLQKLGHVTNISKELNTDKLLNKIRSSFVIASYGQLSAAHNEFVSQYCKNLNGGEWRSLQNHLITMSEHYAKGQYTQAPHAPYWSDLKKGIAITHTQPDNIALKSSEGVLVTNDSLILKKAGQDTALVSTGREPNCLMTYGLDKVLKIIKDKPSVYFDRNTWHKMFPVFQDDVSKAQTIQCTKEFPYLISALRTNYGISPASPLFVAPQIPSQFDPFDL